MQSIPPQLATSANTAESGASDRPDDTERSDARNLQLNHLTQISSQLGYEIVDIAGFLDQIDQKSQSQLSELQKLTREADQVISSNGQVLDAIESGAVKLCSGQVSAIQIASVKRCFFEVCPCEFCSL